jgi:hypothetical protein
MAGTIDPKQALPRFQVKALLELDCFLEDNTEQLPNELSNQRYSSQLLQSKPSLTTMI